MGQVGLGRIFGGAGKGGGEQESCWQAEESGELEAKPWRLGGSATWPPGGSNTSLSVSPLSNTSLSIHAGKVPPMTKGCRGRLANDEKVRCRLWNDEYVWRVVV